MRAYQMAVMSDVARSRQLARMPVARAGNVKKDYDSVAEDAARSSGEGLNAKKLSGET